MRAETLFCFYRETLADHGTRLLNAAGIRPMKNARGLVKSEASRSASSARIGRK